jgi:ParB-like chromosome segregation protein Spo0J
MRHIAQLPINLMVIDRLPMKRVLPLVEYLKTGGTVPPIHVAKMGNGMWKILDGRHRYHAFRLLERATILAKYGD